MNYTAKIVLDVQRHFTFTEGFVLKIEINSIYLCNFLYVRTMSLMINKDTKNTLVRMNNICIFILRIQPNENYLYSYYPCNPLTFFLLAVTPKRAMDLTFFYILYHIVVQATILCCQISKVNLNTICSLF